MPNSYVHVDREVALSRVGGDEDLLREVAVLYLENEDQMVNAIRNAIDAKNPATLEMTAHSLKGSVANFGAEKAVEAAFALEYMGRTKNLAPAEEQFAQLLAVLVELKPELRSLAAS